LYFRCIEFKRIFRLFVDGGHARTEKNSINTLDFRRASIQIGSTRFSSMLSVSSAPSTSATLARDWCCLFFIVLCVCLLSDPVLVCRAIPRSAAAFTGYVGGEGGGENKGPGGSILLCVANSPIPCTMEAKGKTKVVQFTVLNVREKGWLRAPW